MLQIPIDTIGDEAQKLDQALEGCQFPLLADLSREEGAVFDHPVRIQVQVSQAGETLLIDGAIETRADVPCSRCLTPFPLPLETEFSLTATPEVPPDEDPQMDGEVELTGEEMDVLFFKGNTIDLTGEVSQQIIMALPIKPLCKKECKGLCSHCGANLNKGGCGCNEKDDDNPFSVLRSLSFRDKKGS